MAGRTLKSPAKTTRAKRPAARKPAKPRAPKLKPAEIAQIAQIAEVVHETMRAFRKANGESPLPAWGRAAAWMKKATEEGVRFRLENPDAPPSAQHDQWTAEKIAAGWKRGRIKDAVKKTHPLIIPYEKLPLSEKRKDALFAAVVRAMSERL
jgi:hypothetical protein